MTLAEAIVDGLVDVRTHKMRTFLQTLGVVLGVGSLVAVQGLADAGRRMSLKFMAEVGGVTKMLVVNRPAKETVVTARKLASDGLTWEDAQAIQEEVPYLTQVDPIVQDELPVRYGRYLKRNPVNGVTPAYQSVYKFFPARGRFLSEGDMASMARVAVLGDTASRSFFGNEDPLGKTLYISDIGFTVVGVLQRKEFYFDEGDNNALEWMNRQTYVPLTALYSRFSGDTKKRVTYVNIMVDKAEHIQKSAEAVKALIYRRHGGVEDFELVNRADRLKRQEEQGRTFNFTFLAAGIVSLVVGGIVIMNIMLASYQERIREVGVRKAVGARAGDIAAQFLVESILVTSIGGVVGLVVGMGFAKAISFLLSRPAIITPKMALVSVVTSVAVGLFFGLYPALRAARLNPVEALRYE
jgi:putative ABC transport system permease protein